MFALAAPIFGTGPIGAPGPSELLAPAIRFYQGYMISGFSTLIVDEIIIAAHSGTNM